MPGTPINYPIVQGDDDEYYLHHDFKGEGGWLAQFGTVFLSADNDPNFRDAQQHHLRASHERRLHVRRHRRSGRRRRVQQPSRRVPAHPVGELPAAQLLPRARAGRRPAGPGGFRDRRGVRKLRAGQDEPLRRGRAGRCARPPTRFPRRSPSPLATDLASDRALGSVLPTCTRKCASTASLRRPATGRPRRTQRLQASRALKARVRTQAPSSPWRTTGT